MADGAAAAAAPPRADALKAPPRYSLANAAWPDDQLTRLLPTARGADPALANLLRDPAQAALRYYPPDRPARCHDTCVTGPARTVSRNATRKRWFVMCDG